MEYNKFNNNMNEYILGGNKYEEVCMCSMWIYT